MYDIEGRVQCVYGFQETGNQLLARGVGLSISLHVIRGVLSAATADNPAFLAPNSACRNISGVLFVFRVYSLLLACWAFRVVWMLKLLLVASSRGTSFP